MTGPIGEDIHTQRLWERQAAQFSLLGPPLRPSAADLRVVQEVVDGWHWSRRRPPRACILGVTPDLAALSWPPGTALTAVDLSLAMIRGVWSPTSSSRPAVRADWRAMPFAAGSCDLLLGDGCFATVRHADRFRLAHALHGVLAPDARFVTRMFVCPDVDESPDALFDALLGGSMPSFHGFKLRLLMSLRHDDGEVRVKEAWEHFRSRGVDAEALAGRLGWPVAEIRTIEAYRDQEAVYWLPTQSEFRAVLAEVFEVLECRRPDYDDGDRCPTFVLGP